MASSRSFRGTSFPSSFVELTAWFLIGCVEYLRTTEEIPSSRKKRRIGKKLAADGAASPSPPPPLPSSILLPFVVVEATDGR